MVINLIKGLELRDSKGDVILTIEPGTQMNTIDRAYIRSGCPILSFDGGDIPVEDVGKDYVFVYVLGRFVAIPKATIEIPISTGNGWRTNF